MGRFTDAWKTLVGRSDVQIRAVAKLARIEAEWLDICLSIEGMMEQLNHASDRLRQREKRVAKAAARTDPTGPPSTAPPVVEATQLTGRAAVMADLRGRGKVGVASPLAVPDKSNGGHS